MTVFGDLEVSTLRELPAGRAPIQTRRGPRAEHPAWVARVWERVREEAAAGPPGLRRLPPDRGDDPGDDRGSSTTDPTTRGRTRGRVRQWRARRRRWRRSRRWRPSWRTGRWPACGVEALHGRLARRGQGERHAPLRSGRDRRAGRHHRHRGRCRRADATIDGRPRRRPLRRLPAAPAARPRRPGRPAGAVPAGHRAPRRAPRRGSGSTPSPRPPTASSSPGSTSSTAARATCSAPRAVRPAHQPAAAVGAARRGVILAAREAAERWSTADPELSRPSRPAPGASTHWRRPGRRLPGQGVTRIIGA